MFRLRSSKNLRWLSVNALQALLEPINQCTLGTFDQFDECFEANMNVSLILPHP